MPRNLRADAHSLIVAALRSVDPARLVAEVLADSHALAAWGEDLAADSAGPASSPVDRWEAGDTLVVAIGKAAGGMAAGVASVLGGHLAAGVVVLPDGAPLPELPPPLRIHRASHPLPDPRSLTAAVDIRELLEGSGPADRVLVLLSGGGSALVTDPEPGLDLEAVRGTHEALLRSGWPIQRVNDVRRVLDRLKGGGLARLVAPSATLGLVLSDIPGGGLADVASGPLSPASASPRDVEIALRRSGLWVEIPASIRAHLEARRADSGAEPPSVELLPVGDGLGMLAAVRREAERLGYSPQSLGDALVGEARDLGRALARAARAAQDGVAPVPLPACLIGAGEATVTVSGSGSGGPNQEVAVAAARELDGRHGVLVASLGTDGVDGPTDAAGGLADGSSVARARAAGVDLGAALDANDSGGALETLGDRLVTGPTGTNVADLYLALVDAPSGDA